jgi:predicted nucleic acid-binding Zn ribbon protein
MPIYEYETIPQSEKDPVRRLEIRQSMSEKPLSKHPETGQPIKRVYAGFSVGASNTYSYAPQPNSGCACNPGGTCGLN